MAAVVLEAAEEVTLMVTHDEVTQRYLEIRDRRNRDFVTIIELLNPSNKAPGPDREQYLNKRQRALISAAHLVEIDLLRGGPRLPLGEPPPECDYYALISRVQGRPRAEFRRVGLRDRLPVIPVSLRPEDGDARLDLQAILDRVYDEGTFAEEIYTAPPEPPLSTEDGAWAAALVPAT